MQDMIKKHLDAFGSGNWTEFRAALADRMIYDELATRRRVETADQCVEINRKWKAAFPDARATVLEMLTTDRRVIAEVEWQGTHRGQLDAPFGTVPATNKPVKVRAVLVYKVENGKIMEVHHYFDLFSLMTQLGLAPTIGAPSAGAAKPAQATKQK